MALAVTHLIGFGTRQAVAGQGGGVESLSISGTPVLTATEGVAYAGFTATADGGDPPYTFSLVGTWPTGISINSSTGEVSGTPTEDGTFASLSVRVTDSSSGTRDLPTFTLEVDAAGDPYFANVVMLVAFDGSDGATSATDESPTGHTLTFVGNAQIDTAQSKFGGASLLLDGSGDRVTAAAHANFQFGSGQFTIESFVRFNTLDANNRGICGGSTGANTIWTFSAGATGTVLFAYSTNSTTYDNSLTSAAGVVTTGTWYHIAVDRDGAGKIRIYVDGVMVASATPANPAITGIATPLTIGAQASSGTVDMDGWQDEFRITKGVARYASDGGFTVPTEAYPRS